MERKIPKKLAVLATHVDGVTPKTLDSHYAKDLCTTLIIQRKPHSIW